MNFEISHKTKFSLIISKVEKLDIISSSELKSEFVSLNKRGINSIVLDLTQTRYCDSSGLSSILMGNRICKDSSGKFVLVGMNSKIQKLIEISQLSKVLNITENLSLVEDFFI